MVRLGRSLWISILWRGDRTCTDRRQTQARLVADNFCPTAIHRGRNSFDFLGPKRVVTRDYKDRTGYPLCTRTITGVTVVFSRNHSDVFVRSRGADLAFAQAASQLITLPKGWNEHGKLKTIEEGTGRF